jgi:AcrR family transcriptional regulator
MVVHMTPPTADRSAMRTAILDQAGAILAAEGAGALSMRRLAQAVGASTIVLYTHFADKQDILNELYLQGFARLEQELLAVPRTADPLADLVELGRAYRRSAVANPASYDVMFSRTLPGFTPTPDALARSLRCFGLLRDAARRGIDAGVIAPRPVTELAQVLWGTLHGLVSLELLGYWGDAATGEARVDEALETLRAGLARA